MNFETNVRVKTPYGVKIFWIFHFQISPPIILKNLAKKNSQNIKFTLHGNLEICRYLLFDKNSFLTDLWENMDIKVWRGGEKENMMSIDMKVGVTPRAKHQIHIPSAQ